MPSGTTFVSTAPPYVDCIQWVPRRFAGGASPVTISDLVFTQPAIRQVMDQLRASDGATPILGVLIGTVFEDPTCARRLARLERAISTHGIVDEDADAQALGQALDAVVAPDGPERVLGWYRTHHKAGLYLSPEEARLHEERFCEPWECALILAGTADHLAGGVFQRTDPEGLSRSMYTPFYELVEEGEVINATTRRTAVAWTNYQTESRVMGLEEEETPITVATIRELAETVRHGSTTDMDPDADAEWEKIQTQRSLMAVERSLGPGTIGALGAPAAPPPLDGPAEGDEPAAAHDPPTDEAPASTVTPIYTAGDDDPIPGPGIVGRSRRRRRLPAGKIAVAAAGFGLMAAAGWIGSQRILGRDTSMVAGDEAGLTLSPGDLLGHEKSERDAPVIDTPLEDSVATFLEDSVATVPQEQDTIAAEIGVFAATSDSLAEIIPSAAEEAQIVPPPELPDLVVQDPVLAGFENAMTIFRAEVDRYDTDRRAFDEGLSPCNPLNLSYRGVIDAFRRLERRVEEAKAKYGESAVLTFQSAQRQFIVTKTHYELTDCPMPIGG